VSRLFLYFALFGTASALAGEPRFALEPGLELRYAVKSGIWYDGKDGKPDISREPDGSPKYQNSDLTVHVLGRQKDGSSRVLMYATSDASHPIITWADLFPDGRMTLIPSAMPILEFDSFRTIFPLLPKDEHEHNAGWREIEPRTGLRLSFSAVEPSIKAECESPLDRVSMGHWSIRYRLHPETYLPVEILRDGRWDRYNETHSVIVTAKETIRHDGEWVAQFTTDAATYFDATAKHKHALQNDVMLRAVAERKRSGAAGEMLDAGKASLIAARNTLTEPLFREDLDRLIKQCDEYRKSRVETAQRWAKIAGLPSPMWSVADLSGKEHSLKEYRGRVVVLDFWFRQCSFCIRAMPQVEQAAATFQRENAPVSFFGVSIDKEEEDAKFVAETMKLSYPVLRSEKLAEQLGVKGCPTMLVIGTDGTVQGIFVGYSLSLQEDLIECVRGLLK
jgi:peroxiredoxin